MDEAAIFAQIRALAIEGDELVRLRNARSLCEPTAEEARRRREIIDEIGVLQAQLRTPREAMCKDDNPLLKYTDPGEVKIVVGGKAYKPSEAPPPPMNEVIEARDAADAMWQLAADVHKSRN